MPCDKFVPLCAESVSFDSQNRYPHSLNPYPYAQNRYPSSLNPYPYAQNLYPHSLHRCPRWFNPYHSLFVESVPALLYRIICPFRSATHKATDSANKGTDEVNKGTAKAGSRLKGFEVEGV
jgi:hypothetical protein